MLIQMSEEQKQPESNLPEMPKRPGPHRRGRRGGRGRRRPMPSAPVSETSSEPVAPSQGEFHEPDVSPPPKQSFQSPKRRGSPLIQAADEAAEIIESLKHTLAQMEEVLELIEVAERQKISDEHEIESLRRALRQIQSRRPQ